MRIILMLALFCGICWAFLANSERYVYKFSANARLVDGLNAFDEAQRKEIVDIIARFDKRFQIKIHVEARESLFSSADRKEGEILLGLCPSKRQMILFMPAIWRTAIGEGAILQLKESMVEPAFDNGTWPEVIPKVLVLLELRFASLIH